MKKVSDKYDDLHFYCLKYAPIVLELPIDLQTWIRFCDHNHCQSLFFKQGKVGLKCSKNFCKY